MTSLALFLLSLLAVAVLSFAVGLRCGWLLWRREEPAREQRTFVRPANVITMPSRSEPPGANLGEGR